MSIFEGLHVFEGKCQIVNTRELTIKELTELETITVIVENDVYRAEMLYMDCRKKYYTLLEDEYTIGEYLCPVEVKIHTLMYENDGECFHHMSRI